MEEFQSRWEEDGVEVGPKEEEVLHGRWHMIFLDTAEIIECDHDLMEELSKEAEVVACSFEEHVMVSHAAAWTNGKRVWSILYDSGVDKQYVEVNGNPPPQYQSIFDRLKGTRKPCARL